MLAIKLRPVGKRKQISYRIAVMEKKSKLKGKFLEDLGWYNAHTKRFQLKNERVVYWIKAGAQPTDSVHNILVTAKAVEGSKIPLHKKSKKPSQTNTEEKVEATKKTEEKAQSTSETKESSVDTNEVAQQSEEAKE